MYREYFKDYWEVKSDFNKEFVSLWSGWLGKDDYHKLDEVTENEWEYFNKWIRLISNRYQINIVNCNIESIAKVPNIEDTLSTYEESMNKESSHFSKYVLPELDCVISEEWDYTYIIWHKNNGAVESLEPYIKQAGLFNFRE